MNDAQELRLGTRGSHLALWQANTVAARVAAGGGPPCRIIVIKTDGDRLQSRPLSEIGGKGLFVKEIEGCGPSAPTRASSVMADG